jgi:hypothetical protein
MTINVLTGKIKRCDRNKTPKKITPSQPLIYSKAAAGERENREKRCYPNTPHSFVHGLISKSNLYSLRLRGSFLSLREQKLKSNYFGALQHYIARGSSNFFPSSKHVTCSIAQPFRQSCHGIQMNFFSDFLSDGSTGTYPTSSQPFSRPLYFRGGACATFFRRNLRSCV